MPCYSKEEIRSAFIKMKQERAHDFNEALEEANQEFNQLWGYLRRITEEED